MPPKPPKKYDGVFDATKFGAGCLASFPGGAPPAPPAPPAGGSTTTSLPSTTPLQRRQTGVAISTSIPGGGAPLPSGPPPAGASSEDCLFINVFTPSSSTPSSKLPVLMWTYGGAFMGGSSSTFNGSSIVKASNESLVYVSFNYRDLLDEGHGANYGLLDQRAAYDWVKQNIGRFGGDPKRITAFGESAGSQSVSLQTSCLTVSELPSKPPSWNPVPTRLFHDTLSVQDQTDYAATLGAKVGCTPGTKAFVNCLRGVNASVIMANVAGQEWRPTVDKTVLKEMPLKTGF
ncbi:Carboxylesterase [Chytridium lagenaria]|nr:Carboxylesterase [Chytridium lagenaria]